MCISRLDRFAIDAGRPGKGRRRRSEEKRQLDSERMMERARWEPRIEGTDREDMLMMIECQECNATAKERRRKIRVSMTVMCNPRGAKRREEINFFPSLNHIVIAIDKENPKRRKSHEIPLHCFLWYSSLLRVIYFWWSRMQNENQIEISGIWHMFITLIT